MMTKSKEEDKVLAFLKTKEGMYVVGGIIVAVIVIMFWWLAIIAGLIYLIYKQEQDKNGRAKR